MQAARVEWQCTCGHVSACARSASPCRIAMPWRMCQPMGLKRAPAKIRTQLRNESAGTPAVCSHLAVAMPHSKRQHRLVRVRACPAGVSGRTRVFLDKSSVNAGQRSVNGRSTVGQRWPPKTLLPGGFVLRMVIKQCAANTKPFFNEFIYIYILFDRALRGLLRDTNLPGRSVLGGQR